MCSLILHFIKEMFILRALIKEDHEIERYSRVELIDQDLRRAISVAKVILMCGKICSGKSTYADTIRKNKCAVLLSVDEIMLAIFGQDAGKKHDDYMVSLKQYLYAKSVEIVGTGIDVILDIGLWTKSERSEVRSYYDSKNIDNEIHYIEISDAEWKKRIEKRNKDISENYISAYYVDNGLAEKVNKLFEIPDKSEVDVWVSC